MKIKDCFEKGFLRRTKLSDDIVEKEMLNAQRHLQNANQCIEQKMYDLAIVSLYTAMFHAARALLFQDGLKERGHICLILYIKKEYPELNNYAKILDNYRRTRHIMLYGIDVEMMIDDAVQGINIAKDFIKAVGKELAKGKKKY